MAYWVYWVQGLKYLKMSTAHKQRDDGGAEGPERGTEARSAGVPRGWGLGRGAVAHPQYGGLGALPQKILKFNSANLFIFYTTSRQR